MEGVQPWHCFRSPFDTLLGLQQALDAFRTSGWLDAGPSGGGAYPPINVFRKDDEFVVLAEVPGVKKSDTTCHGAYSDETSHRFRSKPATCSEANQPGIPMMPAGVAVGFADGFIELGGPVVRQA